jgi:primosomal protein N' (replication factor Y)
LLTLKGRNEDKVKLSAEHLKRELEKLAGRGAKGEKVTAVVEDAELFDMGDKPGPRGASAPAAEGFRDLMISGPAPAPLSRAENFYRYQIMLRTRAMSRLSRSLAQIVETLALPEDVTLAVDIDPVNLS